MTPLADALIMARVSTTAPPTDKRYGHLSAWTGLPCDSRCKACMRENRARARSHETIPMETTA